jgi:hypothetical protein
MQFTVKVEWQQEDGTVAMAELGRIDSDGLNSATDFGLKLSDTKPILAQLQKIVTKIQVLSCCQSVRNCPSCRAPRSVKGYRVRRLDSIYGKVILRAPRFERCRACDCAGIYSPLTELLPERILPELLHLQAELSAKLPYSRTAAILQKFLPAIGGLSAMTTLNRTLVVGQRIEAELVGEKSTSSIFKRSRPNSMSYAPISTRTARPYLDTPALFATGNESERRTWNQRSTS